MIEKDLVAAISPFVGNRVFPDTAPADTVRPFCIYQQVGGRPSNTFCGDTDKQNARIQLWIWADSRATANTTMRSIASALTGSNSLNCVSLGSLATSYDEITRSYGAQQDFSFWWDITKP